jgi:hypothetical protein
MKLETELAKPKVQNPRAMLAEAQQLLGEWQEEQ